MRTAEAAQLRRLGALLLRECQGRCCWAVEMWLHRLGKVAAATGSALVAAGDVHFHVRSRKPLRDVLTATRFGRVLADCGLELQPNAGRRLRTRLRLAQTYTTALLIETLVVAERCDFSLEELRYQ